MNEIMNGREERMVHVDEKDSSEKHSWTSFPQRWGWMKLLHLTHSRINGLYFVL